MRIAVAMSGGVDSSITAIMLKNQGYEVTGITAKILLCADMDGTEPRFDVCCSPESIRDAKAVAVRYGFRHVVLDVEEDFSREIIDPFCREYLRGRTPSPCIHCNAKIKFRKLLEFAKSIGCEKLATGHYAKTGITPEGRHYISRGEDAGKDQSYFLFMLPQDILSDVLFPLGDYKKSAIRKMAEESELSVAGKPESQEICFVPDNDYPRYIERRTGVFPPPGDIIDSGGAVLGRHKGLHRYTIGQRRGLGIASSRPLYVTGLDPERNAVIAGHSEELAREGLLAADINYMKEMDLNGQHAFIKTRSTQKPFGSTLETITGGGISVRFDEPQAGITPGQAAVFYNEEGDILGGGWIERSF